MKKINLFLVLTSTLFVLNDCSECGNYKLIKARKTVISSTGYDISVPINEFSLKCLKNVSNSSQQNLIISPQLTFINLSKFCAGSDGETKKEMQKVCGFPDDTEKLLKSINYFNYQIQQSLAKNKNMYQTADSLWIDKKVQLKADYKKLITDYLPVEFFTENFLNKKFVCKKVNDWTECHTQGRIKKLLKENDINRDTMLISINTAYFKGIWKNKFKKSNTISDKFFITPTKIKYIEMMSQKEDFAYGEKDYCKYLEMPFSNNEFSMNFILPKKGYNLQNVLEKMSLKELNSIQKGVRARKVDLKLPKFKFESFIN